MKKLKVIISGGGTGGHIFPAISIARAIEKQIKDVEFWQKQEMGFWPGPAQAADTVGTCGLFRF